MSLIEEGMERVFERSKGARDGRPPFVRIWASADRERGESVLGLHRISSFYRDSYSSQQPKATTEFGTYTEEPCLAAGTGGAAIDGALAAAKSNFLVCS